MGTKTHQKVKLTLIVLMMMMISLPIEAQRSRENYTQKVKKRAYYASVNRVAPINNVSYRNYPNRVRTYPQAVVVRPRVYPVARNIRTIPSSAILFNNHQQSLYYSCGNFYRQTNFGYRVISTPIGAQLSHLPQRANSIIYGGNVFYQLDHILLEARIDRRGRVFYEVVGQV